jgi:AcrR family transcriptional regulator
MLEDDRTGMVEQTRPGGRTHQKERTRSAIVAAAHDLAETGEEITMPAIAAAALVSEATAYRYFPDLVSLLRVALTSEDHVEAMRSVAHSRDPVERVGHAAEILARAVLRRQGAVRAMIAGTITRPGAAVKRPGHRFGLIEQALAPWVDEDGPARREEAEQLVRDLAVVISAESLFTLTDLCGLSPDDAVASLVHTARRVTAATVTAERAQGSHSGSRGTN